MGTVFDKNEKSTAVPAPPPASYVDEVSGVEQVPVKNADGSITYVTRALPLSPEEQAKKDELDRMAADALVEIEKLSSSDYVYSESTQQLLGDWESGQLESLNETFGDRKELESDRLAKRGLSDSTAANTIERQTKQDEYDAKKQVERETSAIGESIRATELNNQYNLYGLAQNQLNYDQAKTQQGVSSSLSTINAMNATNAASLNDYYKRTNGSSGNVGPSDQTVQKAVDLGVEGLIQTLMNSGS